MKTRVMQIALLFAFLQMATLSYGQGRPPKDKPKDKPNKNNPKSPQVPIDGGITALLAAGVALGVGKVMRKNQQPES